MAPLPPDNHSSEPSQVVESISEVSPLLGGLPL